MMSGQPLVVSIPSPRVGEGGLLSLGLWRSFGCGGCRWRIDTGLKPPPRAFPRGSPWSVSIGSSSRWGVSESGAPMFTTSTQPPADSGWHRPNAHPSFQEWMSGLYEGHILEIMSFMWTLLGFSVRLKVFHWCIMGLLIYSRLRMWVLIILFYGFMNWVWDNRCCHTATYTHLLWLAILQNGGQTLVRHP